jgi:hypothetical protein
MTEFAVVEKILTAIHSIIIIAQNLFARYLLLSVQERSADGNVVADQRPLE